MAARVLYVALGEAEVPAARSIARLLSDAADTRIVTWLPRLAGDGVTALEPKARHASDPAPYAAALAAAGYPDPSVAADYDRDWHFATTAQKAVHVARVATAISSVLAEFRPDIIVSAVGGETTRTVTDALAKAHGIPTVYFNTIPLPGRFVLLKSLDSLVVPVPGGDTSYRPRDVEASTPPVGRLGQPPAKSLAREGLPRLWAQTLGGERSYPATWVWRKSVRVIRDAGLRRRRFSGTPYDPAHAVRVLYPLHDERDFQIAFRERHAVPQSALIRYLSSTLPAGTHLYLKAHPEHLSAHHPLRWPEVADRPNVHFLPPETLGEAAIAGADVVLTLASSMGLEALRAGKPVVVYGRPLYAGRGVTRDIADPRDLPAAITGAVGTAPDPAGVDRLLTDMMAWSWGGRFTSDLSEPENLARLAGSLRELLECL